MPTEHDTVMVAKTSTKQAVGSRRLREPCHQQMQLARIKAGEVDIGLRKRSLGQPVALMNLRVLVRQVWEIRNRDWPDAVISEFSRLQRGFQH